MRIGSVPVTYKRGSLCHSRFHYLDPLTFTVEGLIASQLGDINDQYVAFEDGTTASVAQYIRVQH